MQIKCKNLRTKNPVEQENIRLYGVIFYCFHLTKYRICGIIKM